MDWSIIGIIISFALGLFMLFLAVFFIKKRRRFRYNGIEKEAVIAEIRKTGYAQDMIVYEYTVAGNKYEGMDPVYGYGYKGGDKIQILYSQDNPAKSMIAENKKGASYGLSIGCFVFLALTLFAVGVVVVISMAT